MAKGGLASNHDVAVASHWSLLAVGCRQTWLESTILTRPPILKGSLPQNSGMRRREELHVHAQHETLSRVLLLLEAVR